jgi:hypothetical protein
MTLKALALGKDRLSGHPCRAFYVSFFSVDGNETFSELRQKWLQTLEGDDDEESDEEPVEFVLIEEKIADALAGVELASSSDSAFHAYTQTVKSVADTLAVKIITC